MSDLSRVFCLLLLLPAWAYALDPTRPSTTLVSAAAERQAPAALHLQAIFRSAQSARAVLNGQSLRVGDTLADARVLAINTNSVLIERDGQQQMLRLVAPVITPSQPQP